MHDSGFGHDSVEAPVVRLGPDCLDAVQLEPDANAQGPWMERVERAVEETAAITKPVAGVGMP